MRALVDQPIGPHVARAGRLADRVSRELGLPTPALVRASMNAIYTSGPAVIRVARTSVDPVVAIDLARHLIDNDLPVVEPFCDGSFASTDQDGPESPRLAATVWRRIELDHSAVPDWSAVGRAVKLLHGFEVGAVERLHPLPDAVEFPWWKVPETLRTIDPSTARILRPVWDRLAPHLERVRHRPTVVVHGDLHPGNVVVERGTGRTLILDWDLLARCDGTWDHAPLMRWSQRWGGREGDYEDFARGYGRDFRDDDVAEGLADLRLVVATVMRVRAAITDPRARAEAARRVRYWRGSDESMWSAV
ncbi:MAG: phosphotransferase family protein [Acidimicrobiia bacterium]